MDNVQKKINRMLSYYTKDEDLVSDRDKRLNDAFLKRVSKQASALNEQGITNRQDTVTNRNTKTYRKARTF
jgi:hypothetical protein